MAAAPRYRFGVFEADAASGELWRKGMRVRLHAQPFQVLLLLLRKPGELLTREEIAAQLWPDGTFVDFDHGVNSAINRLREALGDTAANPRFVETLERRGYRFVAPVSVVSQPASEPSQVPAVPEDSAPEQTGRLKLLATAEDLPEASHRTVTILYALLQLMYLSFYAGALGNLPEIEGLVSVLPHANAVYLSILVSAAVLIPVRAFLLCAVFFRPPKIGEKILRLWPLTLVSDLVWALSPFLLLHHISFGLAMACTALLVYSPFAQRSLILMSGRAGDISIAR